MYTSIVYRNLDELDDDFATHFATNSLNHHLTTSHPFNEHTSLLSSTPGIMARRNDKKPALLKVRLLSVVHLDAYFAAEHVSDVCCLAAIGAYSHRRVKVSEPFKREALKSTSGLVGCLPA